LVVAPLALAQTGETVHVDYEAPHGCPDVAQFMNEVHARSPRIRFADDGTRALSVRLTQTLGRVSGQFTLRDADGTARQRTVTGSQCAEVVSGLALIAAVAIDPNALLGTPNVDPSASAMTSDAGPPIDAAPIAPAPPTPEPDRWTFSLWADAELVFGASPSVLVAVPIALELARATPQLFAPGIHLRFERTAGGSSTNGSGADFTFTVGDLDLCPIAWSPWRFRFQGCARGELGALEAFGTGVLPVRSSVRPFFAVGPVLDVRFTVWSRFFLDLQGALLFAAFRDRYFLEPNTTVFDVPVVGGRIGLGAGATLW
jgi:hypothetical protein